MRNKREKLKGRQLNGFVWWKLTFFRPTSYTDVTSAERRNVWNVKRSCGNWHSQTNVTSHSNKKPIKRLISSDLYCQSIYFHTVGRTCCSLDALLHSFVTRIPTALVFVLAPVERTKLMKTHGTSDVTSCKVVRMEVTSRQLITGMYHNWEVTQSSVVSSLTLSNEQ